MSTRRALLTTTLIAFGSDFLQCDGAELRHVLADGCLLRLCNQRGSLTLVVAGPRGGTEVFDFEDADDAVRAWLAFPCCVPSSR